MQVDMPGGYRWSSGSYHYVGFSVRCIRDIDNLPFRQ